MLRRIEHRRHPRRPGGVRPSRVAARVAHDDRGLFGDAARQRAVLRLGYHNTVTPELAADPTKRLLGARWVAAEGRYEAGPGLFGNYLRLLLPAGSELTGAEGLPAAPAIGAVSPRCRPSGYGAFLLRLKKGIR